MGIQIDAELVPDPNNPSLDVINHVLQEHKNKIERWDKLDRYYLGEHDIFKRVRSNEKTPNVKVMVNHAKYIADMNIGFLFGNPIAYTAGKDKDIKPILETFEELDIASIDVGLGTDLTVFGEGVELLYLKATSETEVETKIHVIDPRQAFVVTDDSVEKNPLFGVYYYTKKGMHGSPNGTIYNIYGPSMITVYRTDSGEGLVEATSHIVSQTPHYFGDVPLNEYQNNEARQGDYEQLISLIDAFNNLQSDRVSDKEAFVQSLLITYGFEIDDSEESADKDQYLSAPSKEDGADVDWLTKMFDENQVQILTDSIEDNIHKISYIPNLNDENFGNNVSGKNCPLW